MDSNEPILILKPRSCCLISPTYLLRTEALFRLTCPTPLHAAGLFQGAESPVLTINGNRGSLPPLATASLTNYPF